jgi:predicted O-linked N-acetylglucosamine transferase (SPINDLY family)
LQISPNHADALHLLGLIAYQVGQGETALELIDRAIQVNPEHAEAYFSRGNALFGLKQFQAAVESYERAILLKPDYAEAYNNRGSALNCLRQHQAALESYDKAILLKPDYAEAYCNRSSTLLTLRQYQAALESCDKAILLRPDYPEAYNNRGNTLLGLQRFQEALDDYDKAISLNPNYTDAHSNRGNALQAITLGNERFIKTESSGKDLVFYCNQTDEIWNPRTAMEKGIGGSEEAVIWLSRLLHRRGWNVTVYANCGVQEEDYDGVSWKPYWMWNYRDKQNVTVLWRYPHLAKYEINSDKVIVDLHDVVSEQELTEDMLRRIDKIFVKSKFHRSLFPHIPDDKFVIVPNGIDARLFEDVGDRDPLLLINTSSADRSIEAFIDCFEEIRKQIPLAKAQWAYGWGVWDTFYSSDSQKMEWKARMQQRMKRLGIEERGRISHGEIAQLYRKANIFAYPSEFAEIDCISLSKAMAAGAVPVTTDFAAMGGKAGHGGVFIHSKKTKDNWIQPYQFHFEIADPQKKSQFVRETVNLLLNPPSETEREPMREWARHTFDWDRIADSWHEVLVSHSTESAIPPEPFQQTGSDRPQSAELDLNRGNEHFRANRFEEAIESYNKALLLDPDYPDLYNNRGSALHKLKRYREAMEDYSHAILLRPEYAEAHHNCISTLFALHQYQSALESCDKAILLSPDNAETHNSRGVILFSLQQYEAALKSYDHAILLKPDYAEAYSNRGLVQYVLQQYQKALESCDKAILLNPDYAEAYSNRGVVLFALQRHEEAQENYDRAILLKPDHAEAYGNRGINLFILQQYQAALESYDKLALIDPDFEYLVGMRLHIKRYLCDWENIENESRQMETSIERGENAAQPFTVLAISGSPAIQRKATEIFVRDKVPSSSNVATAPRRQKTGIIRIGYFSADYFNHATAYLMAELFERHDRSRFEILGFSFGPESTDEMSRRVSTAMDRFINVGTLPDRDIALLSRELEVDIAVDLKGFTRENRAGIFAEHAAPVQVNYLGYPGTMGANYIDYLIADRTLIPETDQEYYSEKIVYLPDSYQPNDSRRSISTTPYSRASQSLPERGFVFCCFNGSYKIGPSVFDSWMRILARVEGSVLWLMENNPWSVDNLRRQAALRGISPDRLIFAKPLPLAEHLARHRLADLSLDTLPYNAHTTTSDALWTGLPVLTRIGETFAGRVAASLLRAIDLPELITATESEFEELAVELAHNPQRLQALRQHLQLNRLTAPLFDCQTYTRHLESAYSAIYERYHAGLPPDHIYISRLP